jgi:alpha-beta hydrolase superfamily lysophospholipase
MSYSLTSINVTSGIPIAAHIWTPPQEPIALIHIFHGMMEHGAAYEEIATYFNQFGIIVVSHDHRGHGITGESETELGYLGQSSTWKTVIKDCYDCHLHFKHAYSNIPFILLGHSMGSFLAMHVIKRHKTQFQGIILSGSTYEAPVKMKASLALASVLSFCFGEKSKANLIHQIIFGGYNSQIKNAKTPSDWLSRDASFVSTYLADPFCGQICSLGFYKELFSCIATLYKNGYLASVRTDLPVLLFSGSEDPVGYSGAGFNNLLNFLRQEGLTEISHKLYEEGRHVMLKETNKEEVFQDVFQWINCHFL